jgi:hypothetical protein
MATENKDSKVRPFSGFVPKSFGFWQLFAVVLCVLLLGALYWGKYVRVEKPKMYKIGLTERNAALIKKIHESGYNSLQNFIGNRRY